MDWKPQKKQIEALKRGEFEVLYGGARGGGKTDAGLAWLLYDIENPLYRALVIRRNADDLSDWTDRATQMYRTLGATTAYRPAIITFPHGAVIKTGHLKDDRAYTKYQGHEYPRILIEELNHISSELNYLKLLSSCRSTKGLKTQVFCTTNPGGVGHVWVQKRWRCGTEQDGKPFQDPVTGRWRIFIPAKIEDNPILMKADPGYVSFLDGLPDKLRAAWRDGRWDVFEGQFFEMWEPEDLIVEEFDIKSAKRIFICGDYGYRAPSAVYWIAETDQGCIAYKELYGVGMDFVQLRDKMKSMTSKEEMKMLEWCVFDTSIWSQTGLGTDGGTILNEIFPMIKASKAREIGWSKLKQLLRKPNKTNSPFLRFTAECRNAIRTMPACVYNDRNVGRVDDMDTDGEDHSADSLRYFAMAYNGIDSNADFEQSQYEYDYSGSTKPTTWNNMQEMYNYSQNFDD